jgi:hypothetical protein
MAEPSNPVRAGRANLKTPPILFTKTQKVIAQIEARLGERFLAYWNSPDGSICDNDVVGL